MEKLSQEYILSILFSNSIEREELLIKKYEEYSQNVKNKILKEKIQEFKLLSQEHLKQLKDKMIKLNIQG